MSKKLSINLSFIIIFIYLLLFSNCKHDEPIKPTQLTKVLIGDITDSSATATSTITEISNNLGNYGHCWSTHSNPTISDNLTLFHGNTNTETYHSALTGLTGSTKYYVRAWAKDGNQTIYGNQEEFTTLVSPYITITSPINQSHWIGAEVHSITWTDNITENVTITLLKNGILNKSIAENIANTGTYNWTIPDNIIYGADYQVKISSSLKNKPFDISPSFKVSEKHGSINNLAYNGISYKTIKIGTQWWMSENLKTIKYNDNSDIPYVGTSWANLTTPAYHDYGNAANDNTYGKLYNWYAANTGLLCPTGWHIPSEADWNVLAAYYGGYEIAGGKLKESGTSHWTTPNSGVDNASGFTALPGGYFLTSLMVIGDYGCWWSTASTDDSNAKVYSMNYNNTWINNNTNTKKSGASIRCIRD